MYCVAFSIKAPHRSLVLRPGWAKILQRASSGSSSNFIAAPVRA